MSRDDENNESAKSKARELLADGLEFLVDQGADSGILKDVPVVGWAAKMVAIKATIQDNLYAAKINKFLLAINEIPDHKREQFKESIKNNSEDTNKLCEKILLSLDNVTDISKADIIANLFLAYLDSKLTQEDFRRCADITCTTFVDDLVKLVSFDYFYELSFNDIEASGLSGLISTPLLKTEEIQQIQRVSSRPPPNTIYYSMSELGRKYINAFMHAKTLRDDAV